MNHNDIKTYVNNNGGRLIGYYSISFPVYGVHVTYDSIDNDPFFPVYRALLKYTEIDPAHKNLSYFAQMIGFERAMLEDCRKKLRDDAMIKFVGDKWVLSDNARSKYLQSGNRSTVRVSGTFLVDGKDLSFLPEIVYSNQYNLRRWSESDTATHKPIDMSMSTASGEMIANLLENKPNLRQSLKLDPAGSNFTVLDFDKQFILGATLVFYVDEKNQVHKDPVYCGKLIHCPAIGDVSCYSIDMKLNEKGAYWFKSNLGYNVSSKKESSKLIIFSKNKGWHSIISERYDVPSDIPICIASENETNLPVIVLDNTIANKAQNLSKMVEDAINGTIVFSINPHGNLYVSVSNDIKEYVDLYKAVTSWSKTHDCSAIEIANHLNNYFPDWRKVLIRMGMYDELEMIDAERFIKNQ